MPCLEWQRLPRLKREREGHTAAAIGDDRVLVVGGAGGVPDLEREIFDLIEVYDARVGSRVVANLFVESVGHSMGRFGPYLVVAGGWNLKDGYLDRVEAIQIDDFSVREIAPLNQARSRGLAVETQCGLVVLGGYSGVRTPASIIEILRINAADMTRVPDDKADFDGSQGPPDAQRDANGWEIVGRLDPPRADAAAVKISECMVLVVGGFDGSRALAEAVTVNVATGEVEELPSMAQARRGHSVTALADGLVLVVGGSSSGDDDGLVVHSSTEILDIVERRWRAGPPLRVPRRGHATAVVPSGEVVVIGGHNFREVLRSVEALPAREDREWHEVAELEVRRAYAPTLVLGSGDVLVLGGRFGQGGVGSEVSDVEKCVTSRGQVGVH